MQTHSTLGAATPAKATHQTALVPAIVLTSLGLFMLWGVGFSHIEALHNAAHDTRHANAFPCH
jgi:cobalt transporter subunit CbtB